MTIAELKKSDFLDQIKRVLTQEIMTYRTENIEGTLEEIRIWLETELGGKLKELFLLSTLTNKKSWPNQKAKNIISLTITRQENKFNA